jgi:hypothetical protein
MLMFLERAFLCPFVFMPGRKFGVIAFAYLIYCRDMADFVDSQAPWDGSFAKSGFPVIVLDSNGPIRGLAGKYIDARPKYFKGPHQPRLGDQAYSELANVEGFAWRTGWSNP